jgi:hypothetical protein
MSLIDLWILAAFIDFQLTILFVTQMREFVCYIL